MAGISVVPKDVANAERRNAVSSALASAISAQDQLSLVYQPIVALETGRCICVEALLRWPHPRLGPISPAEFIPLAEDGGWMPLLTTKVFALAFADLQAWTRRGHELRLSVNISASLLEIEDFHEDLKAAIAHYQLSPQQIELELTESAPVKKDPAVGDGLRRLAGLGVTLAIDDFGVGYSNLDRLREDGFSVLKIDQSFVRDLPARSRDQQIVRSTLSLAHALGYRATAEGVETARTLELLKSWGCDAAQGYFLCKPISFPDLMLWLEDRDFSSRSFPCRGRAP